MLVVNVAENEELSYALALSTKWWAEIFKYSFMSA